MAAVALGASILERHFTDHMERKGPDILCSMDEENCRKLIQDSAEIAKMRGGDKMPAEEERVTIDFAFASVCSIKLIQKGEVFSKNNIWVKRPGKGGIPASRFKDILGKKAAMEIPVDIQLKSEHVSNF